MGLILGYDDRVLRIYEDATFQVEGCMHTLAVLVIFFEPALKYSCVKYDFDNGTDIDSYLEVFEKINSMKPKEIKTFMKAYVNQVDGGMAYFREAIYHTYKKILPKDDAVPTYEEKHKSGSLF